MNDVATTAPTEPQAKAAFDTEQRIRSHIRAMRGLWVKLAEDLHNFQQLQMWHDLGHTGFEAWLASPDIELERRWVYELIAMWRELVVKRGVAPAQLEPVQVSKVREVLPAIRRGQVSIEEALADCEALARDDLRVRYGGVGVGGPTPPSPNGRPLDAQSEPDWAICHACGSRYRVGSAT